MSGDRTGAAPVPHAFVVGLVVVLVGTSFLVDSDLLLRTLSSPLGMATTVALIAGLIARRLMALTPWGLLTGALVIDRVALWADGTWALVMQGAKYALIGGACLTGLFQLKIELSARGDGQRPSRARWGSVMLAASLLAVVVAPRVVALWNPTPPRAATRRPPPPSPWRADRFGKAEVIGRIENLAVRESSGLVASRVNPGLLWTHNDSTDRRLYCINPNGDSCGVLHVTGASQTDWEDIAIGPAAGEDGSFLYIGDIGDNAMTRSSIVVYRFREPTPSDDERVSLSVALRLRYPDGSHDAEALLVHPRTGDVYVITKEHPAVVYKAPAPISTDETTVLRRVGDVSIAEFLPGVTGADISRDGTRVVLSTYDSGFELEVAANFDETWSGPLARFSLGSRLQGEAIAYDLSGDVLFATSEGRRSPVWRVRAKPHLQ